MCCSPAATSCSAGCRRRCGWRAQRTGSLSKQACALLSCACWFSDSCMAACMQDLPEYNVHGSPIAAIWRAQMTSSSERWHMPCSVASADFAISCMAMLANMRQLCSACSLSTEAQIDADILLQSPSPSVCDAAAALVKSRAEEAGRLSQLGRSTAGALSCSFDSDQAWRTKVSAHQHSQKVGGSCPLSVHRATSA